MVSIRFSRPGASDKEHDPLLARAREWLHEGAVLVDVRTKEEYDEGHAQGARNIPVQELGQRFDEIPVGTRVVLYCRSGIRSAAAAALLGREGYEALDLGPLHRGLRVSAHGGPALSG